MKKLFQILLSIVFVVTLASCGGQSSDNKEDNKTATQTEQPADKKDDMNQDKAEKEEPKEDAANEVLEGTVSVVGSTSVEKIGVAAADAFMAENPGVKVTYEGVGSSAGIKAAIDGTADLGTASRNLKESEEGKVAETVIAYDGVAVVVHPSNPVEDLTVEQVQKIYKGEITDWSELGGPAGKIVVVSREDGSGTRGAFEEIVGFENELTSEATISEGNGNVQQTVAGNPLAIGYVSFAYLDDSIKGLKIEGVDPTPEDVLNKTYKVSRPFLMVYQEDKLNSNKAAQAFLDYILSSEGQDIVTKNHGIRVDGK